MVEIASPLRESVALVEVAPSVLFADFVHLADHV